MKNLIKESGIRDINALAKRYPKAEIYFHSFHEMLQRKVHFLFVIGIPHSPHAILP